MADFKKWLSNIPILNDVVSDPIAPYQDAQHTTVENVIRLLINDKYSGRVPLDRLQQGVVMRVITNPANFEYSQKMEVESLNQKKDMVEKPRYKVLILGAAGSHISTPDDYDDPMVETLDDYSVSMKFEGALSLGSIVFVDIKRRIIEYASENSVNSTVSDDSTYSNNSKDTFSSPTTGNDKGVINLQTIPEDITEGEAWAKGARVGKIKLKYIVSYNSQRLRADAADKFNEMCKAAANEQIKIVASSGFRDHQAQIDIYNRRFEKKYPVPLAERRSNPKTEEGKRIGVAAYPGTSNHQSGIAVDVDLGRHKDEKDRYAGDMGKHPVYLWLVKNAAKYGFNNKEGKMVNEPWHWVYNGSTPETLAQAEQLKE